MNQSIDGVAHSVAAQLAQHSDIQSLLMRHFETASLQMTEFLNANSSPRDNGTAEDITLDNDNPATGTVSECESLGMNASTSLSHLPAFSKQLVVLRTLKLRVEKHYRCGKACGCRCHKEFVLRTPGITARFIGSLQISASTPGVDCDEKRCLNRYKSILKLKFEFPPWLLSRILCLSWFASSSQPKPEFVLRILQVRPFDSEIFTRIRLDDVAGVHQLLSTNQASLLDVLSPEHHQSLLMVRLHLGSVLELLTHINSSL